MIEALRERHRQETLASLGLTEKEIANRGLVVVGYGARELLPPYKDKYREAKAKEILIYADSFSDAFRSQLAPEIYDLEDYAPFQDRAVIEVVGSYTNICVATTIRHLTLTGRVALADMNRTFTRSSFTPAMQLGKILVQRAAAVETGNRHVVVGENVFLFYDSQRRSEQQVTS